MTQQENISVKDIVINTWSKKGDFYNVRDYDFLAHEFKEFLKKEDGFRTDKDGMTFNIKYFNDTKKFSVSAWEAKQKSAGGYGGPRNIIVKDFSCNYVEICPAEAFNDLANTHQAINGSKWQYLDTIMIDGRPHVVMGLMDPVYHKLGTVGDNQAEK